MMGALPMRSLQGRLERPEGNMGTWLEVSGPPLALQGQQSPSKLDGRSVNLPSI